MGGGGECERVRLFVGQVPRSMAAEQILAVLRGAARVDEAAVIRDRATGASRGCCFVVCPSREEADKAIAAYHNKCTLPGASRAMQVKYADGELERIVTKQKLFVGMLPRSVQEHEVSALFSQYGNIRELKLLRSPQKTSKAACAILEFESKDHARAAIEALNGRRVLFIVTFHSGETSLPVRFVTIGIRAISGRRATTGCNGDGRNGVGSHRSTNKEGRKYDLKIGGYNFSQCCRPPQASP
ncbi:hypothetical protein GUJ93_ZPchr0007g6088 [Zizania palustris]|uniref:RRM domain-containing protein n=1 Tax=Zizania palustris TaxID=103762 RepID=A0A8J5TJA8_ZIZPA|nr:hypothetical protein GUJ93_ZPchr0007g6088 [Zizania palustris]